MVHVCIAIAWALTGVRAAAQERPAPPPARAEERLAVLEFTGKGVDAELLQALGNEARTAALEEVRGRGIGVMTRDNMIALLDAQGGRCDEGECAVETGRNIGAALVVTAEVLRLVDAPAAAATFHVVLNMYETRTAKLLGAETFEAPAKLELLRKTRPAVRQLIHSGLVLLRGRAVASGQDGAIGMPSQLPAGPEPEEVAVEFTSDPPGVTVLVDGQMQCQATPCSRVLPVGPAEIVMEQVRYRSASARVTIARGAKISLKLDPLFGWVNVQTVPSGLDVSVNGRPAGKTPLAALEADVGSLEVVVDDPCYERTGERVTVEAAAARTVRIVANLRLAALRVMAQDAAGDAADGDVLIEGRRVGVTGTTLRVPVCAKEVAMATADGRRWEGRLSLRAGVVNQVTARVPGGDADRAARLAVAERARREAAERAARAEEERRFAPEFEEWGRKRASAARWRAAGWVATALGVTGGAASLAFAYLGSRETQSVKNGGLATPADIVAAESAGKRYNALAWGSAAAGAGLAAIGIPLILWQGDPGEFRPHVAAAWAGDARSIVVSGVLP